jgi:zinc protease
LSTSIDRSSLPGPETIRRRVFPNGVVGLAWENYSSASVVVQGWLWAGSNDEPREKAGLASLTAGLLSQGTERRTFAQISEQIESLGASLGIASGGHTTVFTCKCLVEDLPQVVDTLTDCLYHPTFPLAYLEKSRGEILTAIQEREHDTQAVASLRFSELMYPDHPYGRSQIGYRETIEALTRQDVQAFYDAHYGAEDMGVTIVGALPGDRALDLLEASMGQWQGTRHPVSALSPTAPVREVLTSRVSIPGKTQADIVLGWVGLRRQDPDFYPAYVANCILGQFGMMGRIGETVRDEQGLAYYAYTALQAGYGPGPWAAIAGVDPDNVEQAVEAILHQVRRLQQEPVGKDELADNKSYLVGSMPLRLEAKESIAAQIAHIEVHQLGMDYLQRFPGLIDALTAEDIMAVANRYLHPDAYVLSVSGPDEGKER